MVHLLANASCSQPSPAGPGLAQGLGKCWPCCRSRAWHCKALLGCSEPAEAQQGFNLSFNQPSYRQLWGAGGRDPDRQREFILQELGGEKKVMDAMAKPILFRDLTAWWPKIQCGAHRDLQAADWTLTLSSIGNTTVLAARSAFFGIRC